MFTSSRTPFYENIYFKKGNKIVVVVPEFSLWKSVGNLVAHEEGFEKNRLNNRCIVYMSVFKQCYFTEGELILISPIRKLSYLTKQDFPFL